MSVRRRAIRERVERATRFKSRAHSSRTLLDGMRERLCVAIDERNAWRAALDDGWPDPYYVEPTAREVLTI